MKKLVFAVLVAVATLQFTTAAQATLLVYEGFNYTTGTASGSGVLLNGQSGGTGLTGSWSTFNNGTANSVTVYQQSNLSGVNFSTGAANQFDGVYSNLPETGGYFGSIGLGGTTNTTDHINVWRSLASSVTATFTHGSTTWFSYVSARAFNSNGTAPRFAIGSVELEEDRGHLANTGLLFENAEAIGVGGGLQGNINFIHAQFWDDAVDGVAGGDGNIRNVTGAQIATSGAGTTAIPVGDRFYWEVGPTPGSGTLDANSAQSNIIIGKIVWSDTGPDVISFARFLESAGTLTEVMFDAIDISSAGWTTQLNLNQSQFDTISIAGGRYFADEIRIGTTFNDVIGLIVVAVPAPAALPAGLALIAIASIRRRRR